MHFRSGELSFYSRLNQRYVYSNFSFFVSLYKCNKVNPCNQSISGGSEQNGSKPYIIIHHFIVLFLFNRSNSNNRNKSCLFKIHSISNYFISSI